MTDNYSDILRNWIPEALSGNVEYFKQLKKYRILDRCKDEYGMTPLMYAVLGKSCFDRSLLAEFAKLCKKSARNCLGHTACDIYICIADPAIFSHTQYRDVFDILDPSNTAKKEAAVDTAFVAAKGLFAAGVAAFAALNYLGADAKQQANMDAAYKRNLEQARFSSPGTTTGLLDWVVEGDSRKGNHMEKYVSKFCVDERERLSHLKEQLVSEEGELVELQAELENVEQSGGEIFREQCRKYGEERLTAYWDDRIKSLNVLMSKEPKDEFETQAEYQVRIDQIMDEQFGPEASDEELLEIREEDLPGLRARTEELLEQKRQEIEGKISDCEWAIQTLELQLDLLDIYAFPFSGAAGAYISLGTYDAEKECFTLDTCRYKTSVHIPRETAKVIRQNSDSYEILHDWGRENLAYFAKLIIRTEEQEFESEVIQCRLLSRNGSTNT